MNEEHNKFTEAEMVVGGLGALFVDGVCAVIDFFTVGIGATFTWVVQLAATGGIEWWVSQKGGDMSVFTAKRFGKYASNFLPIAPTVFVIFLRSVYLHNHPKIAGIASTAGRVVGKIGLADKAASKALKKAA